MRLDSELKLDSGFRNDGIVTYNGTGNENDKGFDDFNEDVLTCRLEESIRPRSFTLPYQLLSFLEKPLQQQ